jgi:hypothetical protein
MRRQQNEAEAVGHFFNAVFDGDASHGISLAKYRTAENSGSALIVQRRKDASSPERWGLSPHRPEFWPELPKP